MNVVIEPVHELLGYRACERLQKRVWGCDDIEVVPDFVLRTVVEGGGLLFGAYDGIGFGREMLGFVLSLLARREGGGLRHQSLMAGVRPDWQGKGVGFALKLAQREGVLRQGIELITWTFDPLESRNAHFNLNKLGAVATRLLPDHYGQMRDKPGRGQPSDRLFCEWHLSSERVRARLAGDTPPDLRLGELQTINRTQRLPGGLRAPFGFQTGLSAPRLLFEIPHDLQAVRRRDMELARAWRMEARRALCLYLDEGYLATGLFHQGDRSFLMLSQAPLPEVLGQP